MGRALLLEDHLIFETCHMEESASHHISGQIQSLGWTQLESTSKIIRVGIENASFGYDLISEMWTSDGPGPDTGRSPDI